MEEEVKFSLERYHEFQQKERRLNEMIENFLEDAEKNHTVIVERIWGDRHETICRFENHDLHNEIDSLKNQLSIEKEYYTKLREEADKLKGKNRWLWALNVLMIIILIIVF